MECPSCKHRTSPDSKIICSHCHQEFPRDYLEEYEKLKYLSHWLDQHRSQLGDNAAPLAAEVDSHYQQLGNRLGLRQVSTPAATRSTRAMNPAPQPLAVPVPAIVAAVPQPAIQPKPVSKPAAPPRPPRPPINWNKLWDNAVNFVVSGALLRALLYMGAFMIVVSAFVLVINFWNIFPPVLQVVFIFALPSAFYLGGWLTRVRLKLAQAGMVITGIGAVLLAVDFAALYQLANLAVDINLYWFFAALITTAVYFFTAYRLQGEFFDYLMFLGGINILLALTRVLNLRLEWTIASVPLASAAMTALALRLRQRGVFWHDTAHSARYLAQVLTPLSLAASLFVLTPGSEAGKTTAFLCAVIVYGLLAWKLPSVWQLGLMLLCLTIATGFGVQIFRPGGSWLPTAGAVLSAGYILTAWRYFGKESQFKQRVAYRQILMVGGFMLAFAALVYSLVLMNQGKETEAAVSLSLLGLSFCVWNLLMREPLHGYLGSFLLLLPFGLWLDLAHLQTDFFPLAYLLLISGFHLPAAILIRRIEPKLAAPFQRLGWGTSILVLCAAFYKAVVPSVWGNPLLTWVPVLTLSLMTFYYVFNTWYFRMPVFAWLTALVFPIALADWMGVRELSSEQIALVWAGLPFLYLLVERSLNRQKQTTWYRLPFGLGVVALALVGLAFALITFAVEADHGRPVTLVALGMPVMLAIIAARLYHNRWILFFEAGLSALFAMLFMQVYAPNLLGNELTASQYGLVLCAVAWFHLLIAAWLDRLQTRYSHGLYLGGYGLAALAVIWTVFDLPTLVWTLASFLLVTSASAALAYFNHHRTLNDFAGLFGAAGSIPLRVVRGAFIWLTAWLFPIWCVLVCNHLQVPYYFSWLGFSLPALLYLPVGKFLSAKDPTYSWPFSSAGHIFTLSAVLLCASPILSLIAGVASVPFASSGSGIDQQLSTNLHEMQSFYTGPALVQLAAVVFYAAWAQIKRQRFFAHVAAWLSILAYSAFLFILPGISARLIVTAWVGWAALLLLAGFVLDHLKNASARHAHGPYLVGYILAFLTLAISSPERRLTITVLGICILLSTASFLAVHFRLHASFDDFINFLTPKDSLIRRGIRLFFLFAAVYSLPLWIIFFEAYQGISTAWQGFSLVALAPFYIGAGLFLRRPNRDYNWPFYSAGYFLTAAGALTALAYEPAGILALALDVIIYAASAFIFFQPLWLYLATFLTPVTLGLTLDYYHTLNAVWIGWSFTGLAFLYFVLGQLLNRQKDRDARYSGFSLPLYLPAYLLSALALVAVSDNRMLTLGIYPANMLLYSLSAWRFRRTIFLYPAVWLSLIPYHNFVAQFLQIAPEWLNLAWLPLILVLIGLGRFVFHKRPLEMSTPQAVLKSLPHPALPFYILAYALSVAMLFGSSPSPLSRTWTYAIVSVLYLGSALLFRHPVWLYPTLASTHLTILAYFTINPTANPVRYISLPFLALTWLEALAGYLVSLRYRLTETTESGQTVFNWFGRKLNFGELRSIGYLTVPSWAQPIFLTVMVDIIAWEGLALTGTDTGVWVSAGFCLLLALFTMLWQDQLLAFLAVGLGVVATGYELHLLGWTSLQIFAGLSSLALGLYLLSWLVERTKAGFMIWRNPLLGTALVLSIACVLITIPTVLSETISTASGLGFAGTIYLTMSLRQRNYLPGYLGMGMLIACWSLLLFVRNVVEPQFYAIPAGLYFSGMGFFEARRKPERFATLIEGLGLAVLLLTSFNQSLNGEAGFPYFLLLLVEGLLVVWWGAARRVRVPFIIGLVASVANIFAQIAVLVNVHKPNPWIIIFGVGIVLVGLGIFVERRREILLTQAREFRLMLDRWN